MAAPKWLLFILQFSLTPSIPTLEAFNGVTSPHGPSPQLTACSLTNITSSRASFNLASHFSCCSRRGDRITPRNPVPVSSSSSSHRYLYVLDRHTCSCK